MVDPKVMCNKHLLGEHVETHMLAGCISKGKSLIGFIDGGLVQLSSLNSRHGELAMEMTSRGMNHRSPLKPTHTSGGIVDTDRSMRELTLRCRVCRERANG